MNHKLTFSEIWKVRFFGFLVFAISLFSMIFLMLADTYDEQEDEINKLVIFVGKVQTQARTTVAKLHQIKNVDCSDIHLEQIARIHSHQTLIQNVTFIKKHDEQPTLVCSLADHITRAFIDDLPTTLNPVKISTYNGRTYITSKFGQYYLTYSASMTDFVLVPDLPHEFIYMSENDIQHINGERGLFTTPDTQVNDWLVSLPFKVAKCSSVPGFCAVLIIPIEDFLAEYGIVVILIFLGAMGLGYFTFKKTINCYVRKRTVYWRVKRGLLEGHFYPLLQPIVDMNTRQVTGCEILARYQDKYGAIYPDQFIPIIEQLGKTWEFTELMLEMTATELKTLTCLSESFRVNINIFPQDIANNNIEELITLPAIMNTPCQFVAEITENQLLELECAQLNLAKLTEQGIGVAIDDFGTGYSNLQLIQKLNCHFLKVDRSFVMDLEEGSVRSSLIPNIIDMAKQNNLKVVAEGIENEQQYLILRRMGVHCGQGWLFAKAMTAEKLEEFTAASA